MDRGQKRKLPVMCEDEGVRFPLDELNQDVLERVLSWLPTSTFFRNTSVCKKWKSVADSATFKLACLQIPARDPWFFMVDSQSHLNYHPIVFDSTEKTWKKLNSLPLLQKSKYLDSCSNFIPVAASGGLICFHREPGEFIACNPVTTSCRRLASLDSQWPKSKHLQAISMTSTTECFKLVSVSGEYPYSTLSFRTYNSSTDQWEEDAVLNRKIDNPVETEIETEDDFSLYFLSKCGNVISTNLQRNPCKQYSSVIIHKNDEEILYFLSSSGTVVSCNLTHKFFFEYPRILPVFSEYAIDIIESGGEIYVVVLHEFLETATLRVWKWDEKNQFWVQIAAMPPAMSHEFYGKKVDINCTGTGNGHQMLVCLNSAENYSYALCNLVTNEWIELPQCHMNGESKELVCEFSFEPRIEASL
ncbi:F-box only 13 [Olea europaea subsp. europaea]|uniref:F-box only 13 n=1 Tax=Olea europaea subsp. europaea TaxID=158383 RepID=A0A8S0UXT0_OLEEU|nr:F-box only 13 [Olea europaea subsp. europaea]